MGVSHVFLPNHMRFEEIVFLGRFKIWESKYIVPTALSGCT